ncbi:phage virion morphogenesis protein [Immundisolibacter sp.]|uniref:phage virion morphogenesis protein n=1 Tax=Immundisolibacter sp. TaxID=1934948 RepID=UPI002638EA93|nr:phage virion morphogenesis protein [Immundisolibacter sp.]MDD3652316.1 phage virion morphogenesis protein [Immundisolibacter sp.]
MTSELEPIDAWCSALIGRLDPPARRKLARAIAADLRRRNTGRIADQVDPDGQAFEPRKPQLRGKKGRIRRGKMFGKLRTARYLKTEAKPDEATVAFSASVQAIAKVHQRGLRDRVNRRRGPEYTYPARRLLGIPDADVQAVEDIVLHHLAGGV